jgi:hypothetical protein
VKRASILLVLREESRVAVDEDLIIAIPTTQETREEAIEEYRVLDIYTVHRHSVFKVLSKVQEYETIQWS